MEEILKLLGKMNSQEVASKIGKNAGLDSQKTMEVIKKALPALMGAIGDNANDAQKAPALDQALSYHENDNVNDLNQFLGNLDTADAQKMLNHILSGKKNVLQQQVAKNANANPNQVNDVMKMLAPILMGALGNQKKSGNININDLGKILGTQSGSKPGQSSGLMDMATKMFDKDGDGSMMDEAADFLGKLLKNK